MAWTTVALVAEKLGIDADTPGLDAIVSAAVTWCASKRPDLTDETVNSQHQMAALLYACHLFNVNWASQGVETFEDLGSDSGVQESLMSEIYRLLDSRRLVLRGIRTL